MNKKINTCSRGLASQKYFWPVDINLAPELVNSYKFIDKNHACIPAVQCTSVYTHDTEIVEFME
jgi:hypothetical protein